MRVVGRLARTRRSGTLEEDDVLRVLDGDGIGGRVVGSKGGNDLPRLVSVASGPFDAHLALHCLESWEESTSDHGHADGAL
jgi:hypothetical protein